ncbi:hypothetical protein HY642_02875 [Candidatus Woesearchaeota archaeon]|nr:hypothetical protein [Candidatus Woesearchaeota archaeon]
MARKKGLPNWVIVGVLLIIGAAAWWRLGAQRVAPELPPAMVDDCVSKYTDYDALALGTGDAQLCIRSDEPQECRDNVAVLQAVKARDDSKCQQASARTQPECAAIVAGNPSSCQSLLCKALAQQNAALCDAAADPVECRDFVAMQASLSDVSACGRVTDEDLRLACQNLRQPGIYESTVRSMCSEYSQQKFAVESGDKQVCARIKDTRIRTDCESYVDRQANVLLQAMAGPEATDCSVVKDAQARQSCQSMTQQDKTACTSLTDEYSKLFCTVFFAGKQPQACSALKNPYRRLECVNYLER